MAWGTLLILPEVSRLWAPLGTLGFQANNNGVIEQIDDRSPAAKAGIEENDRIDLKKTPFASRRAINGLVFVPLGIPVVLVIAKPGQSVEKTYTLTPVPETLSVADKVTLVLDEIFGLGFIAIATILVLQRPSAMTWGFFFYGLWFNPGQFFAFYAWLPPWPLLVQQIAQAIMQSLGYVGLLIFALQFPGDRKDPWRAKGMRLLPYVFIGLSALAIWSVFNNFGIGTELVYRISYAAGTLVYFVMVAILIDTYRDCEPMERQRIKTVIAGCMIGLPFFLFADTNEATTLWNPMWIFLNHHWPAIPTDPPEWFLHTLYMVNAVLPISVAYAVIRHRVIAVHFFLNRGIVVAGCTIAAIASIEFFHGRLSRALHAQHIISVGVVGIDTAVAFVIASMHEKIGEFVDPMLFPKWRKTKQRVERAMASLENATSYQEVHTLLIDEIVSALDLSSAAVFRLHEDGMFVRDMAFGWAEETAKSIGPDASLVLALQKASAPLSIEHFCWDHEIVPDGLEHPSWAIPIVVRKQLVAFGLVSDHRTGDALNPDEVNLLDVLSKKYASAHDHIEVLRLQHLVDKLKGS